MASSLSPPLFEGAQAAVMNVSDLPYQKPTTRTSARTWEAVQTAACLNPVIWCLRIYDDNLLRLGSGDPPPSTT